MLTGDIAHDFNNLLTLLLVNASLAKLSFGPGSAADEELGKPEIAARRAAELCMQISNQQRARAALSQRPSN